MGHQTEAAANSGPARAAAAAQTRHRPERWLLLASGALAACTLGLGLRAAWHPDAQLPPLARTALIAAALIAAALMAWAAWVLSRQRHHLRHMAREVSSALGTGDWQDAVRSLRNDRLGAPSAFDALATGMEGALGESERRWQTLADLAADWYWETDARHRLTWMSGAGALITSQGLRADDMIGRRHDEISSFEPPIDGWDPFHALLDQGRAFRDLELRVRLHGQDEASVWVAISGRPRRDAAGRVIGYEGVGRDITERKRAHERLRASEQRWTLMAGLASDYYWEADTQHRILPLRPEVARRFGAMAEPLEGRTPWEAYPDAMAATAWDDHRADIAARRPFRSVEMDIDAGDGARRIVALSGVPRFDGKGRFLGYHGIGRDITMRREAERLMLRQSESLKLAVAERTKTLETLNHDLEAFSRELAHELRTPIGHVQGLAHLLVTKAGDRLAADEMNLLGLQLRAARHMRETVDALLALARSTAQPLLFEDVDLSALAHEVIAELPEIPRHAEVDWQVAPGISARGSMSALRIVLLNLLGNAAKFTRRVDAPRVIVSADDTADGSVRVRVEDNGAGFASEAAERLFRPFGRLHGDDEFHGTGIGLTIVQRIVERHGGTVHAEGWPGRGACFTLTLPAATPPSSVPGALH
ncbi:MAG: PAS domain S-box protein [Burkholderiaceae bacterium]|nr:PAS domain S-box protein [Burkholderiaceae bacterium]